MAYSAELPRRVRVLVLGGGIHGAGVLHDLASRGWKDVHLVEQSHVGFGTSQRSTKLIHGGLRYLQNVRDFSLVAEALQERKRLIELAPDLVKPIELLFPILKKGGMPRFMVKTGLTLYDRLAGRYQLEPHNSLTFDEAQDRAPILALDKFRQVYSFYDAQTDDKALVERVIASAVHLGANVTERCSVEAIHPSGDGFNVTVRSADGRSRTISALYVVNCLGPWANKILEDSGLVPTHEGVNNKGVHLVFKDYGLKAGLFLQSPEDGRIFFVLPWSGYTLVGTTEELFTGNPDDVGVDQTDVDYLIQRCNRYLREPLTTSDIVGSFAGLRWLAKDSRASLSTTSRSHIVGERKGERGLLMTIYGGKLTTYRRLARSIGDRITRHFGEYKVSTTQEQSSWVKPSGGLGSGVDSNIAAEGTPTQSTPNNTILDRFAKFSSKK